MIVAGLGARPDCDAGSMVSLVRMAAERCGQTPSVLAVPWFRAGDAAASAAEQLGAQLSVVGKAALLAVQGDCPTRSARALAAYGIASVAEGCALAATGPGARLLLPRVAGADCTCAIAGAIA